MYWNDIVREWRVGKGTLSVTSNTLLAIGLVLVYWNNIVPEWRVRWRLTQTVSWFRKIINTAPSSIIISPVNRCECHRIWGGAYNRQCTSIWKPLSDRCQCVVRVPSCLGEILIVIPPDESMPSSGILNAPTRRSLEIQYKLYYYIPSGWLKLQVEHIGWRRRSRGLGGGMTSVLMYW